MSSTKENPFFDLPKVKESDSREQAYNETLNYLLDDNNLFRKHLPKGPGSLMRAVSDSIYSDTSFADNIQQSLLEHLKKLAAANSLPRRLSMFKTNNILLNDYLSNPQLSGFEKVNLELVSSLFKAKVVVYTMTEDLYLTATIINSKYQNTIELLRTRNSQYDSVYSTTSPVKNDFCKDIVLNLVENAVTESTSILRKAKEVPAVNVDFRGSVDTDYTENSADQFVPSHGRRHKKSLSATLKKNFSPIEDQDSKGYNMFTTASPPEDFLKKLKVRKDTNESNFSLKANLDFIEEPVNDFSPEIEKAQFAIKNYPIPSSGLSSSRNSLIDLDDPLSIVNKVKLQTPKDMLFHENLSLAEIEKLENETIRQTQIRPKSFLPAPSQPGTQNNTNSYILKPFNFNEISRIIGPTEYSLNATPYGAKRETNSYTLPVGLDYGFSSDGSRQGQVQPQYLGNYQGIDQRIPQNYQNQFMMKSENIPNMINKDIMRNQIQKYNSMPQQLQQRVSLPDPAAMCQDFDIGQIKEKKKPTPLDPNRRYTGRLKFFDETKNYGFIVMDEDGSDLFVHYDDLAKANVGKDMLRSTKTGQLIKLSFLCMQYYGKYNRSRKAIDIQLLN